MAFFAYLSHQIIDYIMLKQSDSESMSSESQQEGYTPDQEECISPTRRVKQEVKLEENDAPSSFEGKWTLDENVRYVLFMDYYTPIFSSKEKRKSVRIFKSLSSFLQTRTARQCRSHFQKIMNKFKKLNKVKLHYQQLIGPIQYQNRLEALTEILKNAEVKTDQQKNTVTYAVQTDPMQIRLLDLSNEQIIRLMGLLNQYNRSQCLDWIAPQSAFSPTFPNNNDVRKGMH